VRDSRVRHSRALRYADSLDNTGKSSSAFLPNIDHGRMTWIPHQIKPMKADRFLYRGIVEESRCGCKSRRSTAAGMLGTSQTLRPHLTQPHFTVDSQNALHTHHTTSMLSLETSSTVRWRARMPPWIGHGRRLNHHFGTLRCDYETPRPSRYKQT
jgi:hypothetical protein